MDQILQVADLIQDDTDDAWYAHTSTKLSNHEKTIKHGDGHRGNWALKFLFHIQFV